MLFGMEFKCTGFLKGPSICVGPFPLSLIYGPGTFCFIYIIIILGITVSRVFENIYFLFKTLSCLIWTITLETLRYTLGFIVP